MQSDIKTILNQEISPYFIKIFQPYIEEILKDFEVFPKNSGEDSVVSFFLNRIDEHILQFLHFKKTFEEKQKAYYQTEIVAEREQIILDFCKFLQASDAELKEDNKALKRWLDFDAMTDRYNLVSGLVERKINFFIERLSYLDTKDPGISDFLIKIAKTYEGDDRICCSALSSLCKLLKNNLPVRPDFADNIIKALSLEDISIWRRAKYLELLSIVDSKKFLEQFGQQFIDNTATLDDHIFLRAHLVESLVNIKDPIVVSEAIIKVQKDKSPYVRQVLCALLTNLDNDMPISVLANMALNDSDNKVRAAAVISLTKRVIIQKKLDDFFVTISQVVSSSQDIFLIRVCLESISNIFKSFVDISIVKQYLPRAEEICTKLITGLYPIAIKRYARGANLEIWSFSEQKFINSRAKLKEIIENMPNIGVVSIKDNEINHLPLEDFGKVLSLIAKTDFDIEFWEENECYVVSRGIRMEFRLWRFLHELLISSPDKRQGHNHMVGRHYYGRNIVMSNIAEMAETLTPGEPVYIPEEGTSRLFLPLTDYCLSVINNGNEAKIFSSEGVTTIIPPTNFTSRLYAALTLSLKFKQVAKLRNWRKGVFWHPEAYTEKLKEFGLNISFNEYKNEPNIVETKRFFKTMSVAPFLGSISISDYLLSPHENNLLSLLIFIVLVLATWGVKHICSYKKHVKLRAKLPLVMGGWGTRGKTGVERLKAALFNALGFKVVSKTSGCEATIVISDPYQKISELPVFRPYDQSSIWEQREIAGFASKYNAEIFLWECMALRSAYVDIMQSEWMIDDISTITNTHPDHEDIQGPSGTDIARTISSFIKKDGCILTCEDQMFPILKARAREKKANINLCNWMESGLITEDVLNLFPYYEHPANIALINGLAAKLDINRNFALKEMIERVMPDIGALKGYVPAKIAGKTIQFFNGMSANEEVGCLNNWHRLGFDQCRNFNDANIFVSSVVNNRSDRVRRSRVFADIIAKHLCADRHFLIGSNTSGLKGYIIKSWNAHLNDLIALMKESNVQSLLEQAFIKLHVCVTEQSKDKKVEAIKANSNNKEDMEQVEKFKQEVSGDYESFVKLSKVISSGAFPEKEIRVTLTNIFLRKIILIPEDQNDPDAIIMKIVEHTPPGYLNKVMGMQNIKTPGIDFIRVWQEWEESYNACQDLLSENPKQIEEGLETLLNIDCFSVLSKSYVKQAISKMNHPEVLKNMDIAIKKISINLDKNYRDKYISDNSKEKTNFFVHFFKEIFNIFMRIKDRKTINQIYQDVCNKRISLHKAAIELRKYNQQV